jgi:iron complex transport system substrate-binding protein
VVAVGPINQKLVSALRNAHVRTLVVQPRTTEDVLSSITLLGKAVGKDTEAEKLTVDVKSRIEQVRSLTAKAASRPKTLILYSDKPLYTSPPDSFIHDLIGVAGGADIVEKPLPQNIISSAVVIERGPDVIICSPFLRDRLKQLPGWNAVPAVKNNRFFSTTGDAELTRPGPRLAPAVEQLAQFLHPELFASSAGRAPH